MDVYILRHGETHWNAIQRIQGQLPAELNDMGRSQASEVGAKLANFGIQKIFSSDLIRCHETARIVNNLINVDLVLSSALREITYGDWEGNFWENVYSENPYLNGDWKLLGSRFDSPGGEKALVFRKRVISEFAGIVADAREQKILIVSHGQVMKMILSCFATVKESELFTFQRINNCDPIHLNSDKITIFLDRHLAGDQFDLVQG
ncbi:MAG: histidine phosphatase family protein [Candidatus Marinimicrobia bacterium]|jgi:broad specificity phosphatase PhoE|nr:histidine phosphatase family protein [Candidatus Neomarinimicrobiota bacterium]